MQRRPKAKSQSNDEELKGPTAYLALVNGVFYIFTTIIGGSLFLTGDTAIILFGFSIHNFLAGLIWTPITSLFTHSSITHIGGNMIFLFIYGFRLEEREYDDRIIYATYIITGLLSTLLSAPLIGPRTISVGASGAIFGLLGLNAGIERKEKDPNYKSVIFASIMLFVLSSTSPNTNIFAHLFGLIFGFILGISPFLDKFDK